MEEKFVLPATTVEEFSQEMYEKNTKENGPFTEDAEKGEDN